MNEKSANDDLQRSNRRLKLLSNLAEKLLAADAPVDAASAAYSMIAGELDLHAYFNYFSEPDGTLRLDSHAGIPGHAANLISRLKPGEGVCGRVSQSKEAIHGTHIQSSDDPRTELVRRYGFRAYFCNPLLVGGRLLGTLSFGTKSRDTFSQEELALIQTVTRYVALTDQRLRAERKLRDSEARFHAFMNNSPTLAWMKDEQGRHVYVSETYERRFGRSLEEVRGKTDSEIWPQEVARQFRENDEAVLASWKPMEVVEQTPDPAGGFISWLEVKFPFEDAAGRRYVGGIGLDVTGRLRTEEALRRSKVTLDLAVEAAGVGIFDYNPLTGESFWSDQLKEQFGLPPESRGDYSVFLRGLHPEDRERTEADVQRALKPESGGRYRAEYRTVGIEDGRERWISAVGKVLFNDRGEPERLIGATVEITEAKRAQAALQAGEREFRAFFENAAVGATEMDAEGRFLRVNERFRELSGYGCEELSHKTPHDITHPDDRGTEIKGFEGLQRGELSVFEMEKRFVRRDGRTVWVQETTSSIRSDGKLERLVTIVQDITRRKKAETERELLLAELDATINAIADAVVVYDHEGKIVRQNPAALKMLSFPPELLEKTVAECLAALRAETTEGMPFPPEQAPVTRALKGESVTGVLMVIRPTAERTALINVSAAPVQGDGLYLGAVATFTDITAVHELQKEREMIIHTISHDLRTPLTVIDGHSQLLQIMELSEEARLHVEAIFHSAQRMNAMIADMVEAARLEGGTLQLNKEPLRLDYFIADLLRRSSTAIDSRRIRLKTPARLPWIQADPARLERVLTNLLSNALKYSPPESRVEVECHPKNGEVLCRVRDYGQGIAPEDLPHIFDRFYRPKGGRKAGGVGLGLYITRQLVNAHGGEMCVESTPGKGSEFYFTLPATSS